MEAQGQLAGTIGVPTAALAGVTISLEDFEPARLPAQLPAPGALRKALLGRPDLLEALSQYAASEAALEQEVARQYPDIRLGPGYSWDQGNDKWSLGLSLTLPVCNRNEGPIAQAEAGRAEAQARFVALQAQVIGEVDQALAAYAAAKQAVTEAEALTVQQDRHRRQIQALVEGGAQDRLALLSARLDLSSGAELLLEARGRAQEALGALESAVGWPLAPGKE